MRIGNFVYIYISLLFDHKIILLMSSVLPGGVIELGLETIPSTLLSTPYPSKVEPL